MSQPGSVPEQRIQELSEQYRKAMDTVNQLKGTIDALVMQRNQPPAPAQPKESIFEPDVEKGIQEMVSSALGQQQQQFRQAYNALWEKNDSLEFTQLYGRETLDKYSEKIDGLRRARAQQGQFLSRDEAYRYIAFEESGRKPRPQPEAPKEPPKPIFDPYLQQWVIPGQVQPAPQATPAQQQQPVQPQQQPAPVVDPNAAPVNQPVQARQEAPFALPAEGNFAPAAPTAPEGGRPLQGLDIESLTSDSKMMEQFASRYGDVPL